MPKVGYAITSIVIQDFISILQFWVGSWSQSLFEQPAAKESTGVPKPGSEITNSTAQDPGVNSTLQSVNGTETDPVAESIPDFMGNLTFVNVTLTENILQEIKKQAVDVARYGLMRVRSTWQHVIILITA
jgi:hypothetical protein